MNYVLIISVACFFFNHLFVNFISYFHWSFYTSCCPWFRSYSIFLFFIILVGACLPNVLLTSRTNVSNPKFTSLFSVTNDQSSSLSSALKASSLKFLVKTLKLMVGISLLGVCLRSSIIKNCGRWSEI